jgi:hypothetical protein
VHSVLVCQPLTKDVFESPENVGFDVAAVKEKLAGDSSGSFEVLDTTTMSDAERYELYISQAVAAAGNRYRVARVFGSNRHPGEEYGRGVPALVIYADKSDKFPADVYPHEHRDGRLATIADFVSSL